MQQRFSSVSFSSFKLPYKETSAVLKKQKQNNTNHQKRYEFGIWEIKELYNIEISSFKLPCKETRAVFWENKNRTTQSIRRDMNSAFWKLKVVSAKFLLVCFLILNESTCQTRKNAFHFTSKALFVLEKIKF